MRRPDPLKGLPREVGVLVAVAFAVAVGFGIVAPAIPVFARSFDVSAGRRRRHQRLRGVPAAVRADQRSAGRPVRRTPGDGGRHRHRRGQQRAGRPGPELRPADRPARSRRRRLGDVQRLGLLAAAAYGAGRPARAGRAGVFSGGFLLGGITGPALGGIVTGWSLRAPFFLYAGTLAVAGSIGLFALRSTALRDKEAAQAQQAVPLRDGISQPLVRRGALCQPGRLVGGARHSQRPDPAVRQRRAAQVTRLDRARFRHRRRGQRRGALPGRQVRRLARPQAGDGGRLLASAAA